MWKIRFKSVKRYRNTPKGNDSENEMNKKSKNDSKED